MELRLAELPMRLRNQGRDYLREDRLVRRVRIGDRFYAAELRGYQDIYHPALERAGGAWRLHCSCDRRLPCAHLAALMDDVTHAVYPEIPWRLGTQLEHPLSAWMTDQWFPWEQVPDQLSPWQRPPGDVSWYTATRETLHVPAALQDDRLAAQLAEMHPDWIAHETIGPVVERWRTGRLERPLGAPGLWAALQWVQPRLPLEPVWIAWAANPQPARDALLQRLFDPDPAWAATGERRLALLRALTVVHRDSARPIWEVFRYDDPWRLQEADALFVADARLEAIDVLERHMPGTTEARRAARSRLIDWLPLPDSVPHRLAMALDTGATEWVEPVRPWIDTDAWNAFNRALRERSPSEP